MKCEVKPAADVASELPKLVINDEGEILLVRSESDLYYSGVIVASNSLSRLGYASTTWPKAHFEDFHGEVTLSSS